MQREQPSQPYTRNRTEQHTRPALEFHIGGGFEIGGVQPSRVEQNPLQVIPEQLHHPFDGKGGGKERQQQRPQARRGGRLLLHGGGMKRTRRQADQTGEQEGARDQRALVHVQFSSATGVAAIVHQRRSFVILFQATETHCATASLRQPYPFSYNRSVCLGQVDQQTHAIAGGAFRVDRLTLGR